METTVGMEVPNICVLFTVYLIQLTFPYHGGIFWYPGEGPGLVRSVEVEISVLEPPALWTPEPPVVGGGPVPAGVAPHHVSLVLGQLHNLHEPVAQESHFNSRFSAFCSKKIIKK